MLGVLVLGEHLGPWQIVGFVIVLGAAYVINRKPRTAEPVVVLEAETAIRALFCRAVPGSVPYCYCSRKFLRLPKSYSFLPTGGLMAS